MDSNYQYSKQILVDSVYNHNISSSLLLFPHQINIGNFQYAYSIKNYHMLSSISVINYGEFIDSQRQTLQKAKNRKKSQAGKEQ